MTIQDMLDQGITIQGAYEIRQWQGDDCEILEAGSNFDMEQNDIDEDVLNKEITYIYSISTSSGGAAQLIIEVQ